MSTYNIESHPGRWSGCFWRSVAVGIVAVCFGAGLLLGQGSGTAPAEDPDAPMVLLSPYEVLAFKGKFRNWIKVASDHFIVYTDGRAKEAMSMLQQMESLQTIIQHQFQRSLLKREPMIVIMPTSHSDWSELASKGIVEWKTAVGGGGAEIAPLVVCQYDWQRRGLFLIWRAVARDTFERMGIEMEFWFARGISGYYETTRFMNERAIVGQQSMRTMDPMDGGWLPWDRFFEITATSPEFVKEARVDQYEGQCCAFVQFMLTNRDPIWFARLIAWNALLGAGHKPTEDLFRQVFEQDWKEWEKTLEVALRSGSYLVSEIPLPPELLDIPRSQMSVKTAEIRELFVLTQILVRDVPDSETSLEAALARGLETPGLEGLLVEACLDKKRPKPALERLERMIAAGSENPGVYATAAWLRLLEASPKPSLHVRLGGEVGQIRTWCRKTLELEPYHVIANNTLAWAEALAPEVDEAGLAVIGNICRTLDGFSRTDEAIAALAVARWRLGRADSARKVCSTLLASPYSGLETRAIAHAILAELDGTTSQPAAVDATAAPSIEPPAG